jgi:hypothetical protein
MQMWTGRGRLSLIAAVVAVTQLLSGCGGPSFIAKNEPWRADEEQACLTSGQVRENLFVHARSALGGPSPCGARNPFEMSAANGGRVSLKPAATLRCNMVPAVDRWVRDVVEPAAREYLRVPLAELKIAGSYSCRAVNGIDGGMLSEHGHANALDVSGFVLDNGQVISVKTGWGGHAAEQAFLRAVHFGACNTFTTVLGPNANSFHHDHFHLDLARHGRDGQGRICK